MKIDIWLSLQDFSIPASVDAQSKLVYSYFWYIDHALQYLFVLNTFNLELNR